MRRIYFLWPLVLLQLPVQAETREVVYLKNGSIIKGSVLEQTLGKSLKIQTGDGSVFVYKMDEVDRIAKEESLPASAPEAPQAAPAAVVTPLTSAAAASTSTPIPEAAPLRRGRFNVKGSFNYTNAMSVSNAYREVDNPSGTVYKENKKSKLDMDGNFSLLASVEIPVLPVLSLGAGGGYQTTTTVDEDEGTDLGNLIPLYGLARMSLSSYPSIVPYLLFNGGYGLYLPDGDTKFDESHGGFYWGLAAGFLFGVPGAPFSFSLESGYSVVRISGSYSERDTDITTSGDIEATIPRFSTSLGIMF